MYFPYLYSEWQESNVCDRVLEATIRKMIRQRRDEWTDRHVLLRFKRAATL